MEIVHGFFLHFPFQSGTDRRLIFLADLKRRFLPGQDLMKLNLKDNVLTGQVRCIVRGESDIDIFAFSDIHADKLLFKTGYKGMRTQFQRITFRFAAVKRHLIQKAFKIDNDSIAQAGRTVRDFHRIAVFSPFFRDGPHDIFFCNSSGLFPGFQASVLAQRHFRIQGYGEGKYHFFLRRYGHIFIDRSADGLYACFRYAEFIDRTDHSIDHVLIQSRFPINFKCFFKRSLSFLESPDLILVFFLFIFLMDRPVQFFSGHDDLDHRGTVLFFQIGLNIHIYRSFLPFYPAAFFFSSGIVTQILQTYEEK